VADPPTLPGQKRHGGDARAHARRFGWKRTAPSLAHKQPDRDGSDAKVAALNDLKQGRVSA